MYYPIYEDETEMKAHLEALVKDSEELLGETETDSRSHVVSARNKLKISVSKMKYKIHLLEESVREKAKATNEYVHENPWKSMGIASMTTLGIGFIVGFILGREK